MKTKKSFLLFYLFATFVAFFFVLPLVWMVVSSFKTEQQIFTDIGSIDAFLPTFSKYFFTAYTELFQKYNLFLYLFNSFKYAMITVFFSLLVCGLSGYALSHFKFPFKNYIFATIMAVIIIPTEIIILPVFVIISKLQLANTTIGLVLPFIVSASNIYLFRQYFLSFPRELIEAARLDGASNFRIFFTLVFPLCKPIFATIGIFVFLASWNDFLWPVLIINENAKMPVQVGLNTLFNDKHMYTNHFMAALSLATLPVVLVYVLFQKYIERGLIPGAFK